MTGPEHFRKAEQILAEAEKNGSWNGLHRAFTEANAHATLALAAATVANGIKVYDGENEDWQAVLSPTGTIR